MDVSVRFVEDEQVLSLLDGGANEDGETRVLVSVPTYSIASDKPSLNRADQQQVAEAVLETYVFNDAELGAWQKRCARAGWPEDEPPVRALVFERDSLFIGKNDTLPLDFKRMSVMSAMLPPDHDVDSERHFLAVGAGGGGDQGPVKEDFPESWRLPPDVAPCFACFYVQTIERGGKKCCYNFTLLGYVLCADWRTWLACFYMGGHYPLGNLYRKPFVEPARLETPSRRRLRPEDGTNISHGSFVCVPCMPLCVLSEREWKRSRVESLIDARMRAYNDPLPFDVCVAEGDQTGQDANLAIRLLAFLVGEEHREAWIGRELLLQKTILLSQLPLGRVETVASCSRSQRHLAAWLQRPRSAASATMDACIRETLTGLWKKAHAATTTAAGEEPEGVAGLRTWVAHYFSDETASES